MFENAISTKYVFLPRGATDVKKLVKFTPVGATVPWVDGLKKCFSKHVLLIRGHS